MGPEKLGVVAGVYDRAALVARPPERRPDYVEQMRTLVPAGVTVMLLTLEYDPSRMDGPPFSVPEDEVRKLYGEAFEVEQLAASDWHEAPEHLAERGLDRIREVSWMLTRNED
jgi:thiopurine S-methyltransferase